MTDAVPERYKEALRNGHLAVANGRPRDALAHYDEAARLVPQRALPLVSKGRVLLGMRRSQEALRAFEDAVRRDPEDISAVRGKLEALDAVGRREEAAALAAHLALAETAEAERRHGGAIPDAAERRFEDAAAAEVAGDIPRALDGYLAAGRAFIDANRLDAALDACFRAVQIAPGWADVHLQMTVVYLRRGRRELALERMALLDQLLPLTDDPRAQAALAAILREHRARHPELAATMGT